MIDVIITRRNMVKPYLIDGNSRLVVDEDDLKWVKNLRNLLCIGKISMYIFLQNTLVLAKSVFRYVKWCFDASWGLKGLR